MGTSTDHQSHGTPESENSTMLVVRISPALKRAVVKTAKADGAPDTSEWVRRLLVQHTHKERAQA